MMTGMLSHAFGERYDSPVPLSLFVFGGAAVVVLSFLLAYRREVAPDPVGAAGPATGREPVGDQPGLSVLARWSGLLSVIVLLGLIYAGLAGSQDLSRNIVPVWCWVVVWVAAPLLVGLIGDFTRPVNPFAAIARAFGSQRLRRAVLGSDRPLPWPARLGWWLAAALFTAIVAAELIVARTATLPRVTATALAGYALVCAAGGLVFGAGAWCSRAEVFSVLFATWGRLGWFRFGAPGRNGLGGGLAAGFAAAPSRVVFVLLLLVGVSFDGVLSTPQWADLLASVQALPESAEARWLAALTLAGMALLMLAVFGGFAVAADRVGGVRGSGLLDALAGLLPSLLPIAFGYQLAHYLQYIAINGQLLIPLAGDPLGRGWSLLPSPFTADYAVDTGIVPTGLAWYLQIVVIVLVHVAAVVVAHQHFGRRAATAAQARRAEWPWLAAMVGYTMLSLWLLAQPLVQQGGGPG